MTLEANDKDEWEEILTKDENGNVSEINITKASTLQQHVYLPMHFALVSQLRILNLAGSMILELPAGLDHLVNLEEMTLRFCRRLTLLPPEIGGLKSLIRLDMGYCGSLEELPSSIGRLRSLKHWDLEYCEQLLYLPASIGDLESLETMSLLECCVLQSIPPTVGRLHNLRNLIVTCNSVLPEQMGDLHNLETLSFETFCRMPQIVASIGRLHSLKVLSIQYVDCSEIPPGMWDLSNLEVLELSELENLTSLPGPVTGCNLHALRTLDLRSCWNLSSLPEEIEELAQLESLDLTGSIFVSRITFDFGRLKNLKELALGKKEEPDCEEEGAGSVLLETDRPRSFYDSMAGQIGKLLQLESFSLLASEPLCEALIDRESLARLQNQKHLSLSGLENISHLPWSNVLGLESLFLEVSNGLESLPSEIGQLSHLRKMTIRLDALKTLPTELGQLPRLEHFSLSSKSLCREHKGELFRALSHLPKSVVDLSVSLSREAMSMDEFVAHTDLPPHLQNLDVTGATSVSDQSLLTLLHKHAHLCSFGGQSCHHEQVRFMMDFNSFRSVLVDERDTMALGLWPMILQQISKKMAIDKPRQASFIYEMFKWSIQYNIFSSLAVGMECPNDSMECDDVNSMQLDDNAL